LESLTEGTHDWIPYSIVLVLLIIGAIVLFMKNRM